MATSRGQSLAIKCNYNVNERQAGYPCAGWWMVFLQVAGPFK